MNYEEELLVELHKLIDAIKGSVSAQDHYEAEDTAKRLLKLLGKAYADGTEEVIEKLYKATLRPKLVDSIPDYTHRTVTLRIPKGMTIGRTILEAMGSSQSSVLSKSDTDLQKALDEVQPNE